MCWTMHFRSLYYYRNHPLNFAGSKMLSIKQKQFILLMRLPTSRLWFQWIRITYIYIHMLVWIGNKPVSSNLFELRLIFHMWEVRRMDEHWLHRMCNVQCAVNLFYLCVYCWTVLCTTSECSVQRKGSIWHRLSPMVVEQVFSLSFSFSLFS